MRQQSPQERGESPLIAPFLIAGFFLGLLIFSELGRRLGIVKRTSDPEGLGTGFDAAETAVFALLGLMIAFTFAGAASRFEARRHLITTEANAIGTAYLRIDLLPHDAQPELRDLFRRYTEVRSTVYQASSDLVVTQARLDEGVSLQGSIWSKAIAACQMPETPAQATMLMIPALNDMIDITTTRVMAGRNHPPLVVFLLLGGLSLVGAMMIGYDTSANKNRSWFYTVVFAAILSLTLYVIIDLELPRLGLIRVDDADQVLVELRDSMH
jgi:hypothetical protein